MIKKNKKGFLFTFITIFMLFALVVLTYDFLQRNKTTQETISELSMSSRLNFMRENIVSDYFSMLDITLFEITRDENIIVKFSDFSTIGLESVYPGYLDIQTNFTQNHYSNLSNVNINLQNFVPEFFLYPYDTRFVIDNRFDPRHFFIYVRDIDKFNGMEIDIIVNTSEEVISKSDDMEDQDDNNPYVKARVYNNNGDLLFNETVNLNPNEENFRFNPFYVAFNKTIMHFITPTFSLPVYQNLTFSFGRYRESRLVGSDIVTNSTFNLEVIGLEAHISRLYLNFTATEEKAILMTRGTATIR